MSPTITAQDYSRGEKLTINGERSDAIILIAYNAKGQKERIRYGNNTVTRYDYDKKTFRLKQLRTIRREFDPPFLGFKSGLSNDNVLQQLYYTYDAVGNITQIKDDAYEPVFFNNQIVLPVNSYQYDAFYRLIQATGRENNLATRAPSQKEDDPLVVIFPVTNGDALRNYTQYYTYDSVGNITEMRHSAGGSGNWTRKYTYEDHNNRLSQTWIRNHEDEMVTYHYDEHGSMLNLDNVSPDQHLNWDYRDMIHSLDLVGGGWAYYTYDAQKQRGRKLLDKGGGAVEERLYLGGMELYRRYQNEVVIEEIESYHLFEASNRILLVENVLSTNNESLSEGALFRYQYGNHLGSVGLELDDDGNIISYEEYHPYGTTAYRAVENAAEVSLKRYRYTGMERDEESGLGYHGARYYVSSLGRWASIDPTGLGDGINLLAYSKDNPALLKDSSGMQSGPEYGPPPQITVLPNRRVNYAEIFGVTPADGNLLIFGNLPIEQAVRRMAPSLVPQTPPAISGDLHPHPIQARRHTNRDAAHHRDINNHGNVLITGFYGFAGWMYDAPHNRRNQAAIEILGIGGYDFQHGGYVGVLSGVGGVREHPARRLDSAGVTAAQEDLYNFRSGRWEQENIFIGEAHLGERGIFGYGIGAFINSEHREEGGVFGYVSIGDHLTAGAGVGLNSSALEFPEVVGNTRIVRGPQPAHLPAVGEVPGIIFRGFANQMLGPWWEGERQRLNGETGIRIVTMSEANQSDANREIVRPEQYSFGLAVIRGIYRALTGR